MPSAKRFKVVVVGAGNAALCAALAAQEGGAVVDVLECAPEELNGGNSRFTGGAIRFAHEGAETIRKVMPEMDEEELTSADWGSYPADKYFDDIFNVTQYQCDPDLVELFVRGSTDTIIWMRDCGVRFAPMYGRNAYKKDGRFVFFGGLALETAGAGQGLVDNLLAAARKRGIAIHFNTRATELIFDGEAVRGVKVRRNGGKFEEIRADAVILACGGFEANPEMRVRYLGAGWDSVKVRGTQFNTGDGIKMALDIGAASYGQWSGCHAVGWDRNAPEFGEVDVGDQFQKHSYPFGIMVNAEGRRFVDEGADIRNYTYAKYGRVVLNQPGQFAWQIFDQKAKPLLRTEYYIKKITKVEAPTLEELAPKLEGVNVANFLEEVEAYNAACLENAPFDPTRKDGRRTEGLRIEKMNWANKIDTPPYEAYAVTCGITFTFGGLRVNTKAEVLDADLRPIPGLYGAGEIVGGIFYHNYPSGTGLMSGAVFGRTAGTSATQSLDKKAAA